MPTDPPIVRPSIISIDIDTPLDALRQELARIPDMTPAGARELVDRLTRELRAMLREQEDVRASMLTYAELVHEIDALKREATDGSPAPEAVEALVRRCDPMDLWQAVRKQDAVLAGHREAVKKLRDYAIGGPDSKLWLALLVDEICRPLGILSASELKRSQMQIGKYA